MRRGKSCCGFQHFGCGSSNAYIGDIHDRVPVAAELADLLGVDFEKQISPMHVAGGTGVHVRDLEAAAGNGGEDPHQRALGVAIVDVKCVHVGLSSQNYLRRQKTKLSFARPGR